VESVLDGYGIEKSSVSREFVQASAAQLQELCERKLGELDLVALLIDGIEIGKQVLVVALGIATSGEKAYQTARATVRFPVDKKLPVALIRKLIKARIRKNEAGREK
jgi:hypothetical protein